MLPRSKGVAPSIKGSVGNEEDDPLSRKDEGSSPKPPSPSSRLVRRLSRRSSFQTSRSIPVEGATRRSPLDFVLASGEAGIAATQRSPVSLSSGSKDDSVAPKQKRLRSSEAVPWRRPRHRGGRVLFQRKLYRRGKNCSRGRRPFAHVQG